ncbi:MAG TPA: potassium-transporting ATPase subunit C, partial [Planctomycetota bacterium]|nr:potassium-transporting ATPase subunit C [Planctomycetota bacterium]
MKVLIQSLRAVLVLTALTGIVYPAAVLGVSRVIFHDASLGSRVYNAKHELVGSSLLAQGFSRPEYLWPRPSANGYDATNSGGSNVSPVGDDAVAKVTSERLRLKEANPEAKGEPPLLLLTASGSGLDPHLSPEA